MILFAPGFWKRNPENVLFAGLLWVCFRGIVLWGLNHNGAAPAYAYGRGGVPPTFSTPGQLRTHTGSTPSDGLSSRMFGNAIGRGYPVFDNLIWFIAPGDGHVACAVVLFLAWRRDVLRGSALPWACLLIFAF